MTALYEIRAAHQRHEAPPRGRAEAQAHRMRGLHQRMLMLLGACEMPFSVSCGSSAATFFSTTSWSWRALRDLRRGARGGSVADIWKSGPPGEPARRRSPTRTDAGRPGGMTLSPASASSPARCHEPRRRSSPLALVQTICKRTTRTSAAPGGPPRHEARTGRHGTASDGPDDTRSPVS